MSSRLRDSLLVPIYTPYIIIPYKITALTYRHEIWYMCRAVTQLCTLEIPIISRAAVRGGARARPTLLAALIRARSTTVRRTLLFL